MMALVSVRQIKPGTYDAFREAWEPDPWPEQVTRTMIFRNQDNPDQVVTVGLIEGGEAEMDALRDDPEILRQEEKRLRRMAEFEESVLLSGVFELSEEVIPPGR